MLRTWEQSRIRLLSFSCLVVQTLVVLRFGISCLAIVLMGVSSIFAQDAQRIHIAAKNGEIEVLTKLIKQGVDIDTKTEAGSTPLHFSIVFDQKAATLWLLKHGADVEAIDINKSTALHIASQMGNFEIIKALLSAKANVNARGKADLTPLHIAATYGHEDVVQLLLDHGAELKAKNTLGGTPLGAARDRGHNSVVKILQNAKPRLSTLRIQQLLTNFGYQLGSVDGAWGPKSKAALNQFQKANQIRQSDRVNEETIKALTSGICVLNPQAVTIEKRDNAGTVRFHREIFLTFSDLELRYGSTQDQIAGRQITPFGSGFTTGLLEGGARSYSGRMKLGYLKIRGTIVEGTRWQEEGILFKEDSSLTY